jgi:hypothetical protein
LVKHNYQHINRHELSNAKQDTRTNKHEPVHTNCSHVGSSH